MTANAVLLLHHLRPHLLVSPLGSFIASAILETLLEVLAVDFAWSWCTFLVSFVCGVGHLFPEVVSISANTLATLVLRIFSYPVSHLPATFPHCCARSTPPVYVSIIATTCWCRILSAQSSCFSMLLGFSSVLFTFVRSFSQQSLVDGIASSMIHP